jgi:Cu/Ag efflux protein CusF
MKRLHFLLLCCVIGVFLSACADKDAVKEFNGTGRIINVDKSRAVFTVQHEEIEGLMSAMTMDFPLADKKLVEGVHSGIYIDFVLRKSGEELEIVSFKEIPAPKIDGAQIYKESCARCHGDKGEGAKKGIPLIEGHAIGHPEEDFLKQVRAGGEKMPSFSDKLSEKEINAVVKYVREEIQKGLREDSGHEH